ncbi:MAG TPA: hypothetical protein VF576_06240, partial [Rubricoccaceae bacterium]
QSAPSVSLDADGDFVVAWQTAGQDGAGLAVFAQRYNAAAARQGGEFRVNTYTTSDQQNPSVDLDADGDFVVAWQSNGQDDFGLDVFAQRYSAGGVAQGSEFQVNTSSTNARSAPSVSLDADGDFAVAWTSVGQDGDGSGVYARRYDGASGAAAGSEFRVNTYTTGDQTAPSVALDDTGDMVVAWQGPGSTSFSGTDVFAQRYTAAVAALTAIELRGAQGYRMLAAPTAGLTVGTFLGPVWTQGFPGADAPSGGSNVLRYDEPTPGSQDAGFVAPASAAEVMGSGRGYFAYVYEDDDPRATAPGVQGGFPKALTVVGDAPAGDVALPVTYTDDPAVGDEADGWNLVGNPYRTSVDWDLAAKADVSAAVYVYDNRIPGYRVWNGVAGDLERGVVTAGQGFWAKAMDTDASGTVVPSATVPASAQVVGDGHFYGRPGSGGEAQAEAPVEASTAPVVALRLTRGAGGTGNEAAAFVAFVDGASAGMDMWDAYALAPAAATYATLYTESADGTALAIQALPLAAGSYAVTLEVAAVDGGAPAGGPFALAWDGAAFPTGWTARLVDSERGVSVDLTAAGSYAFDVVVPGGRGTAAAPHDPGPPVPTVQRGAS